MSTEREAWKAGEGAGLPPADRAPSQSGLIVERVGMAGGDVSRSWFGSTMPVVSALLAGLFMVALVDRSPATRAHKELSSTGVQRNADVSEMRTRGTTPPSFRGGTFVTTRGDRVEVRVSEAFVDADERGRRWAEFFSGLPHGGELEKVRVTIVAAAELPAACGAAAQGCYVDNEITFADGLVPATPSEEVARHEYGHHVAAHRSNPPWRALHWGPKRWASAEGVCEAQRKGLAFPGDEQAHYAENPGEAWAEVYRVLADRAAGLPTSLWSIVAGRWYPADRDLEAAGRDVLEPWVAPSNRFFRGRLATGGARVWSTSLATPLDGTIAVTLSATVSSPFDLELVDTETKQRIARWSDWTRTTRSLTATICGRRSALVRVTRRLGSGSFRLVVTMP